MSNSTQPTTIEKKYPIRDSSITKFPLCNPSNTSQISMCINLYKKNQTLTLQLMAEHKPWDQTQAAKAIFVSGP